MEMEDATELISSVSRDHRNIKRGRRSMRMSMPMSCFPGHSLGPSTPLGSSLLSSKHVSEQVVVGKEMVLLPHSPGVPVGDPKSLGACWDGELLRDPRG